MSEDDRRLIEEFIPIKEISEESAKEKNRRQGNLSTIHVWWARRPLAACRAAVFSSMVNLPTESKDKNDLTDIIKNICSWEAGIDESKIMKARKWVLQKRKSPPKILDCFAGGGAIPLEVMRLGCESSSLELNPIAYLIDLCTLKYPHVYGRKIIVTKSKDITGKALIRVENPLADDINKWAKWIEEKAKELLEELFPINNDEGEPIAYLWTRTVPCNNPRCRMNVPLIRQTWLSHKDDALRTYNIIIDGNNCKFEIIKGKSKNEGKGNMKMGTVTCPRCNQTLDAEYLAKCGRENLMDETPIVKVVIKNNNKEFYNFSKNDIKAYEKAVDLYNEFIKKNPNLLPTEKLPKIGTLGFRVQRYGFDQWFKLFNKRQLFVLLTFSQLVREVGKLMKKEQKDNDYIRAVITYLSFAVDRLADRNSSFCTWNPHASALNVGNTFGRQALPMVWDYAESNPFIIWKSSIDRIHQFLIRETKIESIPCDVKMGNAASQPYDDNYFDAVITDPPYYDAVPYSDLSDFFYVWLKRILKDYYPDVFSTPLTPKSSEIIQEPTRHNGQDAAKKWYEDSMTLAFKEMFRVLKEDGINVIVFAHKTTAAWETLVNSLLSADLIVTASWPLSTERPGRLRAQQSAALASSIFIVCRKRLSEKNGYFDEIKEDLQKRVHEKLDEFWKQGIRGADFFISAIGPAVEIFGKYKVVRKLSGEEVTVAEFLDLVRQIVTDYSLRKILHAGSLGDIDEITRFYVLWRWAYNHNDIIFDDARKLAQALGTEADQLIHQKDILEKKGDKVSLLGPKEREKDNNLGESKGGVLAPMIDVIHRACLLWEKGDKQKLAEFLEESGYKENETIWSVAQNLSLVLPDGDKEKQLLQGLLASKSTAISDRYKPQKTLKMYMGEEK